jgi:TIR domain-containing protein
MERRDVFLCHAGEDKDEFVRPLAEHLRINAITYWLDEAEIRWGDSITRKVNEGLSKSRFFIPFFTPAFYQRNFPETELYSAIDREIGEGATLILAILAIDPLLFKQRYPLLSSKRFMEWKSGASVITAELLKNLNREYRSRWVWIYPANHKGQVWFRVAACPNDAAKIHELRISWGPWTFTKKISLKDGAVALVHSKSHDGVPVPITLVVKPKAYSDFGTDDPPEGNVVDINRGWRRD